MYALGSWLGPSVETRLKSNNIQSIYTEYGTKTIIEPTETTGIYSFMFSLYVLTMSSKNLALQGDEKLLMAFYLNTDFIDVILKTWVPKSDEIGIITKDLCLNCTENEEQRCLTQTDWCRAITHLSAKKEAWKNLT